MAKRPTTGAMREIFRVEREVGVDDGYGGQTRSWVTLIDTLPASVIYMRGSEAVLAARLAARQPAVLTFRNFADSRGISPQDRAVNKRTGETWNIRELPRESRESRGFLECLIEAGVA